MKNSFSNSKIVFLILAIFVCLAGVYLVFNATRWGPWAFSDSAMYISAAKNFSSGKGFVVVNSDDNLTPLMEFPPFYSIFLSIFLGEDGDANQIIRWVNIGLLLSFLSIYGSLLFHVTKNAFLSSLGMLFCITSSVLIEIFTGIMSESLFFPLLFIILLLATIYIEDTGKIHIFILLTVLSAILPITRYAGTLFVAVIAILLFLFSHDNLALKIKRSLVYLAVAILPIVVWFSKLYFQYNKVGGKSFNFTWGIFASLINSIGVEIQVMNTWIPYYGVYNNASIDKALSFGTLIILAALIIILISNLRKKEDFFKPIQKQFLIALTMLCAYLLFIAFTHSITIPQIDIINRMMAPTLPFFIGMFIFAIALLAGKNRRLPIAIALAASLVILRFNYLTSSVFIKQMNEVGHGYSAREYHESGVIEQLQSLPQENKWISNSSGFVLYYTNRFPLQVDQFANRAYGWHNGYGEKSFREKGAYLILIFPDFRNYYGDYADHLLPTVIEGLDVVYQDEVCGIYLFPVE